MKNLALFGYLVVMLMFGLSQSNLVADSTLAGPYSPQDGLDAYTADTGGAVYHNPNASQTGQCVWFVNAVRPEVLGVDYTACSLAKDIYDHRRSVDGWHGGATPKPGSIMCFDACDAYPVTGHVAIVSTAHQDGHLDVWDSNSAGDLMVRKRHITNFAGLLGYLYAKGSDTPPILQPTCEPADVWWTSKPIENRWYRSNEHLTYDYSGTSVTVQESPAAGSLKSMYLNEAGLGWHDYHVRVFNECRDETIHWIGGWDNQTPSITLQSPPQTQTWYNSAQTVRWVCSDAHSGVKMQQYRWDGGPWLPGDGSADIPGEGKNTLEVYVEDDAWNGTTHSGNSKSITGEFWLDSTPPTTSATLLPSAPDGENGWYTNVDCVNVQLPGSDAKAGVNSTSGLEYTYYHLDDGPLKVYRGLFGESPFHVCGDGAHIVAFWSTDLAGNTESTQTCQIKIDATPPTIVTLDDGAESASTDTLTATWTATDATSGIAEYQYAVGSTPGGDDIVPWASTGDSPNACATNLNLEPWNTYYFKVKAKDNAGNWSDEVVSDGVTVVPGQDLRPTLDSGGVSSGLDAEGVRRSTNYAIVDSIGQFVVSTSESPNYTVQHGYWSGVPEVLTSNTPEEMRRLPNDSRVRLARATPVTAGTDKFSHRFYIGTADRSSGLLVRAGGTTPVTADTAVTLAGKMSVVAGERCLDFATVESIAPGDSPKPVAMSGLTIGGVPTDAITPSVLAASGLYNGGLLIKTSGLVTYTSPDGGYFYIDDGSKLFDGSTHRGVRVALDGLTPGNAVQLPPDWPSGWPAGEPFTGHFVVVTGISSVASLSGQPVSDLRIRQVFLSARLVQDKEILIWLSRWRYGDRHLTKDDVKRIAIGLP